MPRMSREAAEKFCMLCNWAYEVWVTHRTLFDDNAAPQNNIERTPYFTHRLQPIIQEYCLQQIAKLHDPAEQGESINLSIEFVVLFDDWGPQTQHVVDLRQSLDQFWQRLKTVRNKLLAHNDLPTLLANHPLGSFPEDADRRYFEILQMLVNLVHEKWVGGPSPFNDLARADARELLNLLDRAEARRGRS